MFRRTAKQTQAFVKREEQLDLTTFTRNMFVEESNLWIGTQLKWILKQQKCRKLQWCLAKQGDNKKSY